MNLVNVLQANAKEFDAVVPFTNGKDGLLLMDFTEKNKFLTTEIISNTDLFIQYKNELLLKENCRYGVGGYNEHRTVYSRSKVFDGENKNEEPRRLHLGIDIWEKHGTAVMAPLDGIVHSFAFNNAYGDYGATIILTHNLQGHTFHTLYGHLSLSSIKNLQQGKRISKGEVFAAFGIPAENGQWPPHLHFQIIEDMQGKEGDFPGVCKFSEREIYLKNCPDPDLILKMMQYAS